MKATVTALLFQPSLFGAGLTLAEIEGAIVPMLTVTEVVVVLPALSVAVPWTILPEPAVAIVCACGQLAIPDNGSAQTKLTVTGTVLVHPLPFKGGEICGEMVGPNLSILRTTEVLAVSPPASVVEPDTFWLAPSVAMVWGSVHLISWVAPPVHWK